MINGNNPLAIKFYKKALAVDPKFTNSAEMLKKLTQK